MNDKEKIEEALRLTKASMTYTKDERAHGLPTVHTLLVFLEEIKKSHIKKILKEILLLQNQILNLFH